MTVKVHIPTPLRQYAGQSATLAWRAIRSARRWERSLHSSPI